MSNEHNLTLTPEQRAEAINKENMAGMFEEATHNPITAKQVAEIRYEQSIFVLELAARTLSLEDMNAAAEKVRAFARELSAGYVASR